MGGGGAVTEPSQMVARGINETAADYWIHFHPIEEGGPTVYWYRVPHMRAFICRMEVPITLGRSKDGFPSGAGYLVPKETGFILKAAVPPIYMTHIKKWDAAHLTDRQAGFAGEEIVDVLLEHGVISLPGSIPIVARGQSDQFASVDMRMEWKWPKTIEIKVERRRSEFLFVQTHERGHRVHTLSTGEEHITDAPGWGNPNNAQR